MTLLYVGSLVLLGYICARVFGRMGLPSVTGYLIAGLLAGPSALEFVGKGALDALAPVAAFGLATIFFMLGEEFKLHELRKMGGRLLALTVIQCVATVAIVAGALVAVGVRPELALLLGAIAGTTDPAATLVVIRELRAHGELVRALKAVVALNGVVEMVLFTLLLPLVGILHGGAGATSWAALAGGPAWEIGGSLALGLGLAVCLRGWSLMPCTRGALKVPTIGLILLGTGLCQAAHLSTLLTMLAFGAVVANAVPLKGQIFDTVRAMEGPLLVCFFTLAGAGLHLADLTTLGLVGAVYVTGRIAGKLLGSWAGARVAQAAPTTRRWLGCGLVPQASMAIGLAFIVQEKFPDVAGPVLPVVLGSVVLFEVIGPVLTRLALLRSGEAAPEPALGRQPALEVRTAG